MNLIESWKIPYTTRKWLSVDIGWLEGLGFSRCSNSIVIHPIPFLTIFIEW